MITDALFGAGAILALAALLWFMMPLFFKRRSDEDAFGINSPLPPEDPYGEDGEDSDTRRPTHFKP